MRYVFSCLLITSLLLASTFDAYAKRFGGGRSFGVSRAGSPHTYSRTFSNHTQPATPPSMTPSVSPFKKWLGPIAGLAIGGLLASLFMGHGIGSGVLSWIVLLGAAFFIWQLFRSKTMAPSASTTPSAGSAFNEINRPYQPSDSQSFASEGTDLGCDIQEFLRQCKSLFLRLQTDYDTKNINDIREFTTPDVLSEIQLQFQERGDASNHTEVITLQAQLLGTEKSVGGTLASVLFSGSVKEDGQHEAEPFQEIWHFKKEWNHSTWKVAGVQQSELTSA